MGKSDPPAEAAKTPKTGLLDGQSVRLVAITQHPDDRTALQDIAQGFDWKLSIVDSSASAIALLGMQPTPLVICDSDLRNEDWRSVLTAVTALPEAVCVLLASSVVDEYLRTEVLKHRGYDVVAKPFQREDLRRAVTFAWSWRGWTSRHAAEQRKPSL